MEDNLKHLKQFFAATCAAFECAHTITLIFDPRAFKMQIHVLHELALVEVNRLNPDMEFINGVLAYPEIIEKYNKPNDEPPE